ncbi:hypothetical protein [Azospirillum halopraeferens]|uniref:hypothetical protein n=1 Tax=Azospirillum halopraeferens TaxID=34010 RepID=UPI00041627FC|nr:hypothetical protein [Azospirillum halopraeferens]
MEQEHEISFAELIVRRGAELLEAASDGDDTDPDEAADAGPVDAMARLLATVAITDGPLVIHMEGGGHTDIFEEAAGITVGGPGDKVTTLAEARQPERAVVFEFDPVGQLAGSRAVVAVVRPEDRHDLLEAYVAVGRLRGNAAELTVAPVTVRLDARALGHTLDLIGPVGRTSVNAIGAAMAHASQTRVLPGQDASDVPPVVIDLCWHAFCLSAVRARRTPDAGPVSPTIH